MQNDLFPQWEMASDRLVVSGALVVGNGRPLPTTDAPKNRLSNYHDLIKFLPKTQENNYLKIMPFYEQKMPINEIARQTGIARSTVRSTLKKACLPNNKNKSATKLKDKKPIKWKGGGTPFGYAYLEGKFVIDPKEYKVVLTIYREWLNAQSYRAIARNLNAKKIKTRNGKVWTNEIIKRIIDRHECDLKMTKNKKRKTK